MEEMCKTQNELNYNLFGSFPYADFIWETSLRNLINNFISSRSLTLEQSIQKWWKETMVGGFSTFLALFITVYGSA